MSDNKSIIIKTILDKTGINRGIKEIQTRLNKNPIRLSVKADTKKAEKEVQAAIKRMNKQMEQSTKKIQKLQNREASSASPKARTPASNSASPSVPSKETAATKERGGLIRLIFPISNSPFLATVRFSSDAYEVCR